MNLLDIIIVIFLISSLFRGREIGFVRQLFSTIGFFGGLWIGTLLAPHTVHIVHSQTSRSLVTLLTTLGCALILLGIGEYIGILLKERVRHWHADIVDRILGSALAIASFLAVVWLSASILVSLPYPGLQSEIRGSRIVGLLTDSLPPAPNVIADLGHLIDPNGFPQVFSGSEPAPPGNAKLPSLGELQPAVNKDRASVVKVEGQGCGGIVEGSGFVVSRDLVATNAHVVAGIANPYVADSNGVHSATPIWFDPNLDFAVLKVGDLAGSPLFIDTDRINQNTPGAVLGYPGGGDFEAKAAAVLDEFTAHGRNIYDQGSTARDVYEIRADIIPGNSGGPLVDKDGAVIGIVFAESTTYNHVGYALNTKQVVREINQAQAENHAVGTGKCAQ
jgi:S1-C subfamily serine protease